MISNSGISTENNQKRCTCCAEQKMHEINLSSLWQLEGHSPKEFGELTNSVAKPSPEFAIIVLFLSAHSEG